MAGPKFREHVSLSKHAGCQRECGRVSLRVLPRRIIVPGPNEGARGWRPSGGPNDALWPEFDTESSCRAGAFASKMASSCTSHRAAVRESTMLLRFRIKIALPWVIVLLVAGTTMPGQATARDSGISPALCGPGDNPEPGIQGDVPGGPGTANYNCGLTLVGQLPRTGVIQGAG